MDGAGAGVVDGVVGLGDAEEVVHKFAPVQVFKEHVGAPRPADAGALIMLLLAGRVLRHKRHQM